jgi:hypothetical protein
MTRLWPIAMALAMVGAPVMLEACETACWSTTAQGQPTHHTHRRAEHAAAGSRASCHPASALTQRLVPSPRPCDHEADVQVARIVAPRSFDSPQAFASPVPAIVNVGLAGAASFAPSQRSRLPDRLGLQLAGPLRI